MKQDLEKFVERYPTYIEALEMLEQKDQRIAELEQDLEFTTKTANDLIEIKHKLEQELAELKEKYNKASEKLKNITEEVENNFVHGQDYEKLKQELAELKEKDNYHLRYELAGADETIANLKKQLEEKDKEIEKLKQQYTILENENGKLTTELIMDKYKKAQKEVSFGKQLAIQELEKVHAMLVSKAREVVGTGVVAVRLYTINEVIDQQIKELKGEK